MNELIMNNLEMNKDMAKKLDSFLATKTTNDINRNVYLILPLRDEKLKITTCLVFNCHHEGFEEPTSIQCNYTGIVIHLPAFWVDVPKELAFNYICGLINSIYSDIYTKWYRSGLIGGINTGDNTGFPSTNVGCGCIPKAEWKNV